MKALVLANSGDEDPGYVGERLIERGYDLEIAYRDKDDTIALDGVDVIVLLGSDWSVYWDRVASHVEREVELIPAAAKSNKPLLGICYGAQIMSHALGGSVERADVVEIGWFDVHSDDPALAPPGLWFEYHVDKFTPPPQAEVLASTTAGPQAYRLGRMLAVQFHPEVTPDIIRRWGGESREHAERYDLDFDAIYRQSDQLAGQSRARCHALVDAFLDRLASPSATP
ncbi:MAG: type 1 glutamine amidotransferase [Actinomycetes bacterium]